MTVKIIDTKAITRDKRILQRTKVQVGGLLSNGATLLAETPPIRFRSEVITSIVLAVGSGYQPFIVWTRCRDITQFGDANARPDSEKHVDYFTQGHYFRSLDDALHAYNEERDAEERKAEELKQPTIAEQAREMAETLDSIATEAQR